VAGRIRPGTPIPNLEGSVERENIIQIAEGLLGIGENPDSHPGWRQLEGRVRIVAFGHSVLCDALGIPWKQRSFLTSCVFGDSSMFARHPWLKSRVYAVMPATPPWPSDLPIPAPSPSPPIDLGHLRDVVRGECVTLAASVGRVRGGPDAVIQVLGIVLNRGA
jgi:hypothetical protein